MSMRTSAKRVLVLRAGMLGDTVFATSLFEPLRASFGPDCRIDLVLKQGMAGLFRHDTRVGDIFEVKYRRLPCLLSPEKLPVLLSSRRHPYHLLVNLESGSFFNGLVRLVKADRKFGTPYATAADDRPAEHAVERLRRIYRLFLPETAVTLARPSLVPPPASAVRLPAELPRDYVIFHPANSHFRKNDYRGYRSWPLEHWKALARLWEGRPERICFIGSAGEAPFLRELLQVVPQAISLVGRTSLEQLSAVIAGAKALVTTDTGPSHVAGALGTPVIVLFGPSEFRRTAPFSTPGNRVLVLSTHQPCSPCSLDGRIRTCPQNRCMTELVPEMVFEALRSVCAARERPQ